MLFRRVLSLLFICLWIKDLLTSLSVMRIDGDFICFNCRNLDDVTDKVFNMADHASDT